MLRTRFVYAILASLAVIALGGLYQAFWPKAPSAPIAAPPTAEAPADAAAPETATDAAAPEAAAPAPP